MSTAQIGEAPSADASSSTLELYWLPGCSACMRMKEFVEKSGKPFEAINLEASPERGDKVRANGLWVPAASIGEQVVNGHNLDQVAKLIGVPYESRTLLTPEVLLERYNIISSALYNYVGQMTEEVQQYKLLNRDRTMLMLAHHTSTIARAYLSAYYYDKHDKSIYGAPDAVVTLDEVLATTGETRSLVNTWWEEDGQDDPLDRILETDDGWRTLHEVFEREVWHTAQHTRQLKFALEKHDIVPEVPLTGADWPAYPYLNSSMPDGVSELTSSAFDELVPAGGTWLVDFWAEWCGPCHALGPVLEGLAAEGRAGLQVGKLDVSQHPDMAERFAVKSLPTIVIFRDGAEVSRLFGVKTLRQLGVALDRVEGG